MAQSSSCDSPEPESPFPTFRHGITSNNMDADSLYPFESLSVLQFSFKVQNQETPRILNTVCEERDEPKLYESSKLIHVSNEDYEILPSYMKTVAPWKDLQSAVEKMNSFLSKKGNTKQNNFFHPEELESMGLGRDDSEAERVRKMVPLLSYPPKSVMSILATHDSIWYLSPSQSQSPHCKIQNKIHPRSFPPRYPHPPQTYP
ncbi:uncharacterized protein [Spinacia oleracea]|uniref:Uncharacterized protein isoform X2 n=1 Tax=Spinacia oleracea TaxID=3562 RepID=A0ABM3R0H5_SPIOL|nr:uncharacterized protein LOC110794261 isoform X2 [Spinacia oleracea]